MRDQDKTKAQLLAELVEMRREVEHLKTSEERFRQAVVYISDHIYVSEVTQTGDYINRYISPQAEILTGYPLHKFTEDWNFWASFVIHPEDRAKAAAQANRLAGGQNSEVEYRMVRADGRVIWVRDSGKIHIDAETGSIIIYGVVSDISERKHLESQLNAIYQLGQEINLLRNETEILERVLETAGRILPVKIVLYGLVNPETQRLEYRFQRIDQTIEEIDLRLNLEQSSCIDQTVVQQGEAVYVADAHREPDDTIAVIPKEARAHLSVPIKTGQQTIGVLHAARLEPNGFSPNDQQLLRTLADQAAIAIENARLYREIGQRVEELVSMSMISQAITATLDLPETLTIITDHAVRLFNACSASVALYDKGANSIWFAATSGERADVMRDKKIALDQGIVGWVIRHGEPALAPNVAQDDRFCDLLDHENQLKTRTILCYPLQTRSENIGAIEVVNKKTGAFTQADMRLLSWLAMPAVNAIENARLYEAQRVARGQAETLSQATWALTSILDLDQVLDHILVQLEQVVPYDTACVFLKEGEWLKIVAGRGEQICQKNIVNRIQHPVDNPLFQKIRDSGHPVILENAQTAPDFQIWEGGIDYVRGWMGVPLVARNEVIGYVTLDSHQAGAYDQNYADLAQAFANQAAVAIQNAQLFEEVDTGRQRLQSLSHRLVEVQETERRYVARELHDEAGQALTALMVGLRLLEKNLHKPQEIPKHIAELKQRVDNILENLHRLAINLHPATLDHLGLVSALDQYVAEFGEQNKIITQFETVNLTSERLPSIVEVNIFRIVQEALTNTVRHAQATHADVILKQGDTHIVTIIEDNGIGFNPTEKMGANGRLGLAGMLERTEMMNGKLEIESSAGTGTTVYVEIPYAHSDSNH